MKNEGGIGNLCQYAIQGKQYRETFPYPYKCAVFYECRYIEPTEERTKWCTRKPIGDRKGIKKEDVLNRKIKRKMEKKNDRGKLLGDNGSSQREWDTITNAKGIAKIVR